jgi:ribonuclease HI
MTTTNLRILQLNIMKSRAGMEALINDKQTRNLDILLIQEPPLSAYQTHVHHRLWQLYQPTYNAEGVRKRSLVYVNKRISTSAHRQVPCNSPDISAVKIWTEDAQILIFSVYIPPLGYNQMSQNVSIQPTLDEIQATVEAASRDSDKPTRIIMAGDFNRHHPAWSNRQVNYLHLRHAEELLAFIQDHRLGWGLPSGTPTYWSLSNPGKSSTIDLTLTDTPEWILRCQLYHDNYGSDHRGTFSEWNLQPKQAPGQAQRHAFDRADWASIGRMIQSNIDQTQEIENENGLDHVVNDLIQATSDAVKKHTPVAKPSPYAKRWFTPELKTQQMEVNRTRRRWQESCAVSGKDHPTTTALFAEMRTKRREWTRTIEKTKSAHWNEFLDAASSGTLWKAAAYLGPRDDYANIPPLMVGEREIAQNAEKAQVLLESFFPRTAEPTLEDVTPIREEIPWIPINELEIERALKAAKGNTAPGEDCLPTLVWKNIWKYVSEIVTQIFQASINLGYYPKKWKIARIVTLRKPGKPDYTVPGAYRPISLLNTLGKLLEAVMAKRLSYYAETHNLLPDTQFGGRPGRTTEQALLILANEIDRAWLRNRVVTLVAFDLKGAFNGVNKQTLDARLKERGIPTTARRWIQSFMEGRTASIKFDDFETEVRPVENAGLAQGSPLSPILFAFFNSDLVDQPVDTKGGASAFIDDYFRWRVGRSAEENLQKLQDVDIPRIEAWARRTGSSFAAEKTELIHLTRRKKDLGKGEITMNGKTIKASATAKLLGVVFDQEMRWKHHVQKVVKKATKVALNMGGLRNLRPTQMTQLYQACVAPQLDYASTVWHNPNKDKMHLRALAAVQRTALLKVLSAFRTVATQTLEAEAHVLPSHLRLKLRAQDTISRLYTLPRSHPIRAVLERMDRRTIRKGSGAKLPLAETAKTLDLDILQNLELIDPKPLKPWRQPAFKSINIENDKEKANGKLISLLHTPETIVYPDASEKKGQLGAAVVILNQHNKIEKSWQASIGTKAHWSVHIAELIAIYYAMEMIESAHNEINNRQRTYTIATDSRSALQVIESPSNKPGQQIVQSIINNAENLRTQGIEVCLLWIPGHSGIPGNDAADKLAKTAVGSEEQHIFQRPLAAQKQQNQERVLKEWQEEWRTTEKGKHLRRIDDGLPSKHTQKLYGPRQRNRAYLLTQLRTGHSWLASHAKVSRFREEDKCECGARETVVHVLVDCPLLQEPRRELRSKIGDAFNNISIMLGGKPHNNQRRKGSLINTEVVNAVLDFAQASQRFQSRQVDGSQTRDRRQRTNGRP